MGDVGRATAEGGEVHGNLLLAQFAGGDRHEVASAASRLQGRPAAVHDRAGLTGSDVCLGVAIAEDIRVGSKLKTPWVIRAKP